MNDSVHEIARRGSALLVLTLISSACTTIYRPSEASPAPRMERDDAEIALIRRLKEKEQYSRHQYEEVLAGDSSFRFLYKNLDNNNTNPGNCPYAGTPAPEVKHVERLTEVGYSSIDFGGCVGSSWASWRYAKNESADRFADALFVLANNPPSNPAGDPEFQKTVQQYRAAGGGAQLSEEVRAHRIAAEGAVKEKRFEDAVNEYGEALKLAPWWPQGHFNRALILAELGALGAAEREMKRYLALEPNAENARQIQDKIYAWRAKVK